MIKKLLLPLSVLTLMGSGAHAQNYYSGKLYYNSVEARSISDAGFATNCEEDAYDGAFYLSYDEGGIQYDPDPADTDTTGTTITGGLETTADGLKISKSYYFDAPNQTIRVTVKIENPTATNVTNFPFKLYSEYGSDGDTQVDTTSSGGTLDAVPTNADRWIITSDGDPDPILDCYDPIQTWVRFSPGASVTPKWTIVPGDGGDEMQDSANVAVPAGAIRYFVYFNRLDSTLAAAKANLSKFESITSMKDAGLFNVIPTTDYDKYVNFSLASILTASSSAKEISNSITLYPNPASGAALVNVKIDNAMSGNVTLGISDARGLQVKTMTVSKNNGTNEFQINLDGLQPGVYSLQVTQGTTVGHKLLTVY